MSSETTEAADRPDDEPETYEAVTVMVAREAAAQALVLGRIDDPMTLAEPEVDAEGRVVRIRRAYEPVSVCPTPEPMPAEDVFAWLADPETRELHAFEDYDWDEHDRKQDLAAIVDTRAQYRQLLLDLDERLDAVETHVASVGAMERISAIRDDIWSVLEDGTPVEIDQTGQGSEGDDEH